MRLIAPFFVCIGMTHATFHYNNDAQESREPSQFWSEEEQVPREHHPHELATAIEKATWMNHAYNKMCQFASSVSGGVWCGDHYSVKEHVSTENDYTEDFSKYNDDDNYDPVFEPPTGKMSQFVDDDDHPYQYSNKRMGDFASSETYSVYPNKRFRHSYHYSASRPREHNDISQTSHHHHST